MNEEKNQEFTKSEKIVNYCKKVNEYLAYTLNFKIEHNEDLVQQMKSELKKLKAEIYKNAKKPLVEE